MEISVKTATDDCCRRCPSFRVRVVELYQNNGLFYRSYKCENLEKCNAMMEAIHGHSKERHDTDQEV
jgi:hypothetical protein